MSKNDKNHITCITLLGKEWHNVEQEKEGRIIVYMYLFGGFFCAYPLLVFRYVHTVCFFFHMDLLKIRIKTVCYPHPTVFSTNLHCSLHCELWSRFFSDAVFRSALQEKKKTFLRCLILCQVA